MSHTGTLQKRTEQQKKEHKRADHANGYTQNSFCTQIHMPHNAVKAEATVLEKSREIRSKIAVKQGDDRQNQNRVAYAAAGRFQNGQDSDYTDDEIHCGNLANTVYDLLEIKHPVKAGNHGTGHQHDIQRIDLGIHLSAAHRIQDKPQKHSKGQVNGTLHLRRKGSKNCCVQLEKRERYRDYNNQLFPYVGQVSCPRFGVNLTQNLINLFLRHRSTGKVFAFRFG